jgi:hypothetical protein
MCGRDLLGVEDGGDAGNQVGHRAGGRVGGCDHPVWRPSAWTTTNSGSGTSVAPGSRPCPGRTSRGRGSHAGVVNRSASGS